MAGQSFTLGRTMATPEQRGAFGRELAKVREARTMTQAALAAAMPEEVRVTPAAISQWVSWSGSATPEWPGCSPGR